jgi:putative DNA primase/helicase
MFSNSGLVGIDIDKCVIDGKLTEKAWDIVEMLDSYTEISTSGTGLHIIMKGYVPGDRNRKDGVEMYDKNRFFVMTGSVLERADQEGEGRD